MDTLKVKMQVGITAEDWSFYPGEIVELDIPLVDAWVEAGHAVKIKGEKVDKRVLPEGVEYKGFGIFKVVDQYTFGKDKALEILPDLKMLQEEAGDVVEPTDVSPADSGANNAGGSESPSKG